MASILVMEDNAQAGLEISEMLRAAEYEVEWCQNATDAKAAITERRFDLLVVDLYVHKDGHPVSDGGLSVIGWIRASNPHRGIATAFDVPIVAISGAGSTPGNPYALVTAEAVGANASLAKPLDRERFLATVSEHLGAA